MKSKLGMVLVLLTALIFTACAQIDNSSIGDGVLDPVEAAFIQVAVGASMAALPETIEPAHKVTTALLALNISSDVEIAEVSIIDVLIANEMAKLDLDAMTLQSCDDLIVLVKAKLNQQFADVGIAEDARLVIVWQVIDIVHKTAEARLAMVTE